MRNVVGAAVAYDYYGRCVAWRRVCARKSHSDLENFGKLARSRQHRTLSPSLPPPLSVPHFVCRDERFISTFWIYLFLLNAIFVVVVAFASASASTRCTALYTTATNSITNMIGATYVADDNLYFLTTFHYYYWRQSVGVEQKFFAHLSSDRRDSWRTPHAFEHEHIDVGVLFCCRNSEFNVRRIQWHMVFLPKIMCRIEVSGCMIRDQNQLHCQRYHLGKYSDVHSSRFRLRIHSI